MTMTDVAALQPTDAFDELGRIKFSATDFPTVLAKIAELAKRTIPGADDVSITLADSDGAHTAAFTGQQAVTLDEWQYQQGYGHCLAAAAATITVRVLAMFRPLTQRAGGESRLNGAEDR